jgi:hypothetical protein
MVESTPPLMATPTFSPAMVIRSLATCSGRRRGAKTSKNGAKRQHQLKSSSQQRGQYLTVTANGYFFFPGFFCCALATSTAEKPAEMPCLKFPGWALFLPPAFFNGPAILVHSRAVASLVHRQKIELAFDMNGNGTPSLFVALDSLQGNPKQAGKRFLGFSQFCPQLREYFTIHDSASIE